MLRYEGTECPVCKKRFTKDSDIVVCPVCGTPHHRECYNYVGHCVNEGLHKIGFDFQEEENLKKNDFDVVAAFKSAEQRDIKQYEAEHPDLPPLPAFVTAFDSDNDRIGGEKTGDVAAAVRNNAPRFIRIFKKLESGEKRLSWNWGAFFFGSLYYFYRKVYRHAVSLISLAVMLLVGSDYCLAKFAPKTMELMAKATELISQNNVAEAQKILVDVQSASDYGKATIITYSFMALLLIIHVAEALAFDKIYKGSVISLIKRVQYQLVNGAEFSTPYIDREKARLSTEQMMRIYLSSKGGTNLFAPLLAFLAVQMLLNFI